MGGKSQKMLLANPFKQVYRAGKYLVGLGRNPTNSEESLSDEKENDVIQTARSWPYS